MTTTKPNRVRSIRRLIVTAALAATALTAAPAAGEAATVKFGAELNPTVQPSNSGQPKPCSEQVAGPCTRVMMDAYGRPDGGDKAPRNGTIKKLRLIAGAPGSFRLQLAKANPSTEQGKVLRNGPVISYQGQADPNAEDYTVETFNVNVAVKKGERLAFRGNMASLFRCSSGGANQLLFSPPLLPGAGFEQSTADDGCWMLLEAVVKY
jgi:hypothetical protein